MNRDLWLVRGGVVFLVALGMYAGLAAARPASAATTRPDPRSQTFVTPTPGPDGKIIYIVQEGDVLWTIAALSGKTVEELRALNGLQPNDILRPGMQLLLGLGGPVLPTTPPDTRPTATLVPLTPTPVFGTGELCILLFDDVNGNAVLDEGESPLPGGQISVSELSGTLAGEHTTEDSAHCFADLLNGDYNVSAAPPTNYNPTTTMNVPVRIEPGDFKNIEFGAQASAVLGGGAGGAGSRSVLLGTVGALLLLAAGALGYVAVRYNRRSPVGLR
ncbi:MAG TPA: LysM domain-containing protein [Anaerolineales bacterium]|nr:LysM domain-containing protein [Anaerolineales bacterium]